MIMRCMGLIAAAGCTAAALAAPLTPGNVVVYRVGPSAGGLLNTGAQVFVDEYTPTGTLVQSIPMPNAGTGPKLVASGTASSEGLLTVSPNGDHVVITGYNSTIPAASSISSTASNVVNRTVARIDVATGLSTFALFSDFASTNNPRSAVTDNGSNLWFTGGTGGVRYGTIAGGLSTQINSPNGLTNLRQVNIFNGQLFVTTASTGAANTTSLGTLGVGLPTAFPANFVTLPGLPPAGTISGISRYAFVFADLSSVVPGVDTLYVADDGPLALSKYSFVGGAWVLNGTVGVDADDYRGVTADVQGTSVGLFATRRGGTAAPGGGELVTLVDASGYNGAFGGAPVVLSTAAVNVAYRGVGFIPRGVATGACCDNVFGGCTITPVGQCAGVFQGIGTSCTPTPCAVPVGACCTAIDGCTSTTFAACQAAGGSWAGPGSLCPQFNCPEGACCDFNTGNCTITGPLGCQGGQFFLGLTCTPNPCVPPTGACCNPFDGSCAVTAPGACNGVFAGVGTSCMPNNCPQPSGACCDPQSGQCQITSAQGCVLPNQFQGPNTVCQPNPCVQPTGACCDDFGMCTVTLPNACFFAFQGVGTTCNPNLCPVLVGACCTIQARICALSVQGNCVGLFLGAGTLCFPDPCPVPAGACCDPATGQCNVVAQNLCNFQFLGAGSVCGPVVCPVPSGACCNPNNGQCAVTAFNACNGNYQGNGSVCGVVACPVPVGACCDFATGQCQLVAANQCNFQFLGAGSVCGPAICPIPTGACCDFATGQCQVVAFNQCGFQFLGVGTACVPALCPIPTGACCDFATGQCQVVAVNQCPFQFLGAGSVCAPAVCPLPVSRCCVGARCILVTAAQCAAAVDYNGVSQFTPGAPNCNILNPLDATQPCCLADYNKIGGVTVPDIFDFLTGWFSASPNADINGGGLSVNDIFNFLSAWFAGGC
jgi:hypothetical protein